MSDHRRLQRTLFRMQLDPAFARSLREGEPRAAASTGLGPEDLRVLAEAPPAGVEADFGGRRRSQFLGNVASEFVSTAWVAVQAGADVELVESFTGSEEFHRAAAENGRFPLAFADHALRRARSARHDALVALATLEAEMARARRQLAERRPPRPGEWLLAPTARVVDLPSGTFAAAASLRVALDEGRAPAPPEVDPSSRETLLIHASSVPTELRRSEVGVEPLGALPAALLHELDDGLADPGRASFCRQHEVEPEELADFVTSLVSEGLVRVGGDGARA